LTINWRLNGKYNVWAENCDFPNSDIEGVQVGKWSCSEKCYYAQECTHFTWSQGNCWLNRDKISKNNAFHHDSDVICDIMH
jgi:hypothetical protein